MNRFFSFVLFGVLLLGCVQFERDNPLDPGSDSYLRDGEGSSSGNGTSSSSSTGTDSPSSSSSKVHSSSSSAPSSSSLFQSSSSSIPSSSSLIQSSSSSVPSSSSSIGCPISDVSDGLVTCGGQTYKTVVIGTQTWMAENLNYNAGGSKCYDNNESNCDEYGRLYNWVTAMGLPSSCNSTRCSGQIQSPHRGICPEGWHIPSNAEWDKLLRYVDGSSGTSSPYNSTTAGKYLKATSGWNKGGNGTDDYEFSALPGGERWSNGSSYYVGDIGNWWSATESDTRYAYFRYMYCDGSGVDVLDDYKSNLYSVRCMRD